MKKLFAFILLAVLLMMVVGCTPGSTIQINTPVPNPAGTAVPNGQVTVPSVSIQVNAPGPNPLINQANANGQIAGALIGLWHGFISPATMLLSFINTDVQMFEVHNDGSAYNLGFFLGILILFAIAGVFIGTRRG